MNKSERESILKDTLRQGISCFDVITYQTGFGCHIGHLEYKAYRHGMKGYHEVLKARLFYMGTDKDYSKHENNNIRPSPILEKSKNNSLFLGSN